MLNNQTQVKKVNFDDVRSLEVMEIDSYLSLPPVPQQRDTELRAKKKQTREMLSVLHPSHLDVGVVELRKDCEYFGKKYKKGSRYIVNGNTRAFYWANGLTDAIPAKVNATIYKVDNMEDVADIYNTYDNPSATERNQEKLYGIIFRTYDYVASSTKVEKGEILTALQYACLCLDPIIHSNKGTTDLPFKVKAYIEEIKTFDSICKSPKYWDQALTCAALMLLKKYGTDNKRLLDFLSRIDKRVMDTSKAERDGATHVCWEWSTGEKWKDKRSNWTTEGGLHQTVSFILYWAEKFMNNKVQTQLGSGWDKYAETWFDEHNAINNGLTKVIFGESDA